MTAYERLRALCDAEENIWYWGNYQEGDGSRLMGVFCAIGVVCGRQTMIIANDNTQSAGSWVARAPEKIVHAQKAALRLGIPVIYLVECAGLFLPTQEKTFAGEMGAGRIFETQAELGKSGVLQLAAVFGDCIAGGGYMPLLCDKIVMTERASLCIGGTAIHSHAKGQSEEMLGGPQTHVHQSGCVDCRVADDKAALEKIREWMALMPTPALGYYRMGESMDSPWNVEDLDHLIPVDLARPLDICEILARLTDAGQFQILHDGAGSEITAALALIDGLPVVFVASAGAVLYRDGITKMRMVAAAARDDGIPMIWLQDVAGFDVGPEAEREGLLGHGAMLLRELSDDSNSCPPSLTVILRKASGAGYYAMKGAPFHPAWVVATAVSRLEVMQPQVLAGVVYDSKMNRLGDSPKDLEIRAKLEDDKQELLERQILNGQALSAAKRGDVDDIVPLCQLRKLCISFVRCAYQSTNKPHKPHRLWSLLATL